MDVVDVAFRDRTRDGGGDNGASAIGVAAMVEIGVAVVLSACDGNGKVVVEP